MVTPGSARPERAAQRLYELGIQLPASPEPFGIYAEIVQTGNLRFLSPLGARVALELIFQVAG